MEARVQFRVDEADKALAQAAAKRHGSTLSDACRKLTHELAEEQRQFEAHDAWLASQIAKALRRLEADELVLVDHAYVKFRMNERKAALGQGG